METHEAASQATNCGECSGVPQQQNQAHQPQQQQQQQQQLGPPCCAMRFLSADELASIIDTAVLVDVRAFSDYTVGHIRGAVSVRLSSILIRRLACGKISCVDIVIDEQKERFRKLTSDPSRVLVVYDENAPCCADKATLLADTKSPLAIVAKSLCRTFPAVAVLQGSFSAFKAVYPHLVDQTIADDMCTTLLSPSAVACVAEPLSERSPCERSVRDTVPSEILPYLYVGSQSHAQSREILDTFQFTHILNITSTCPNWFPNSIVYKTINIRDTWNQNITSYFEQAFEFIESAKRANGKVLVHCVAGISRSPTITIAYLMKTNGWTLCEALAYVKSKRSIISPNLDFLVELQTFERQLFPSMGPAPPVISPDTQVLLGPSYPCAATCQPALDVPTQPPSASVAATAMECSSADPATLAPAPAPVPVAAVVVPTPLAPFPSALPPSVYTVGPACAPSSPATLHRASTVASVAGSDSHQPSSPWLLSGAGSASGSASSLLLPPSLASFNSAHAHTLAHTHSNASPAELRLGGESYGRRSGSASEGCSPRLKSPFQVSLSVAARTSPKAPRRDPQSPFVQSPSSQGIFVL